MSDTSCQHGSDAAGWVLGALTPDEAERFATHLQGCAECRTEVAELTRASERLAHAAPLLTPPPELRERLMAAVHAEASLFNAARTDQHRPAPTRRRRQPPRRVLLLATFATLAVMIAAIALVTTNQGSHSARPRTVVGKVTSLGGGARAHAVVQIQVHAATLILTRLTAPPAGRVYQAWVVRHDSPATPTGALFSVPRSGNTRILLPALHDVTEVIVTAEPPRDSAVPTLPPVVLVQLTA